MKLIQIVEVALKANGYDGLVFDNECGCVIGDLSPGDCIGKNCEAAYKHTHSQRPSDWMTSTQKNGVTDDDIDEAILRCG